MNIVIDIDDFKPDALFFQESIKNTVMDNSEFIRILYSTDILTLNGIYLKINMNIVSTEKYFNKYKCSFNIKNNITEIEKIEAIEKMILERLYVTTKNPIFKVSEQLNNGNIKLFTDNFNSLIKGSFILKISGVWKTPSDYGITYKFMDIIED